LCWLILWEHMSPKWMVFGMQTSTSRDVNGHILQTFPSLMLTKWLKQKFQKSQVSS
jgi:hypothetical protein